jgi:hypothetical protein
MDGKLHEKRPRRPLLYVIIQKIGKEKENSGKRKR